MSAEWMNRGGQTQASVKLPPMDLNKEHVFELVSIDFQDGITETYQGKTQTVNKCKMVWKEADKEKDFHRVWVNVNEFYSENANLMKFLISASGKPFVSGIDVKIGDYLSEHHRIKARVTARIKKDTGEPNGYYDFIKASIRPDSPPQTNAKVVSLADALKLVVGSKNAGDAFAMLIGKVPQETIKEFVAADKRGEITYPIR